MVRATDPAGIPGVMMADPEDANSGTVTVVITVTDVNEAPAVTGGRSDAAVLNEENDDIADGLATYTAAA